MAGPRQSCLCGLSVHGVWDSGPSLTQTGPETVNKALPSSWPHTLVCPMGPEFQVCPRPASGHRPDKAVLAPAGLS